MSKKRIFILALLVLIIGTAAYSASLYAHSDETIATVCYRDEVLYRFNLQAVTTTRTYTVGEDGAQNVIEVSPQGIAVIKADCPDQVCVRQGYRHHGPKPIVCLPHGLSIRFSESADQVDATTGQ